MSGEHIVGIVGSGCLYQPSSKSMHFKKIQKLKADGLTWAQQECVQVASTWMCG